jgi:DNA-binding HxlR family transcriptional regulator
MRTYGQFCALAKALDVIGDRWTLLIVRELLIRIEARYTDLRDGLPGIATNLLATRLKEMEEAGVIERFDAPPPVATTLFRLTPRGKQLERVIDAIGGWGVPMMKEISSDDAFCSHWVALPLRRALKDHAPGDAPAVIEVRTGEANEQPVTVRAIDGTVRVQVGAAENPDAVVSGSPKTVYALFRGEIDLAAARAEGLEFNGDVAVLRRVQPHASAETDSPKANSSRKSRSPS